MLNSIPFSADAACKSSFGHELRQDRAPCGSFERITGRQRECQSEEQPWRHESTKRRNGEHNRERIPSRSRCTESVSAGRQCRRWIRRAVRRRRTAASQRFCVSATYSGPAPSDTMSHAAPTPCMNVPTSESCVSNQQLTKDRRPQRPPEARHLPFHYARVVSTLISRSNVCCTGQRSATLIKCAR